MRANAKQKQEVLKIATATQNEHRRLFDEKMAIVVSTKRDNSPYLTEEEYTTIRDVVAGVGVPRGVVDERRRRLQGGRMGLAVDRVHVVFEARDFYAHQAHRAAGPGIAVLA